MLISKPVSITDDILQANQRWFVVCDSDGSAAPEDRVWTVSRSKNKMGWNTDSGFPGYGLTTAEAEELAYGANLVFAVQKSITTTDGANFAAAVKGSMT
jgi:hypothetical protein